MHTVAVSLVVSLALGAAPADEPAASAPSPTRWRAVVPAAVSGVSLLAGVAFVVGGRLAWAQAAGLPTPEAVEAARGSATSSLVGGVALLGFGALTGALAVVLFAWAPAPAGSRVALVPLDGGGLVTLGVGWP
jgi:hypothetical protein